MVGREVRFVIPGRVGGKGRPRATIRAGHAAVYTPAKTVNMEQMVRGFGAAAMTGKPLLDGALDMTIAISLERPVSWSKAKRAANPIPTGKPDLDNRVKLVSDSLNGIVYRDDSQISDLHVTRRFVDGIGESVEVIVRELVAA